MSPGVVGTTKEVSQIYIPHPWTTKAGSCDRLAVADPIAPPLHGSSHPPRGKGVGLGYFLLECPGLIFFSFSPFKGEPHAAGYASAAENDVLPVLPGAGVGEALLQLLL